MRIILASASPRRKELLEQINMKFEIMVSNVDEVITQSEPSKAVQELACQKAEDVAKSLEEKVLVIGADTIVVHQGVIMGKPRDKEDAFEMLNQLQGKSHTVYTGVSVWENKKGSWEHFEFFEGTEVSFYPMKNQEIEYYIQTNEPMDKAGAYGIQGAGAAYIKKIEGDYNAVVGLPIGRLYQEFINRGIAIFEDS
ncbi:Maf family protein [Anaerosacchariphilus polymeriproducens]|uniref:dTTP/UTP pyrophosphatase n=1 Tax=Anaerosacchariphilus polymeriproducens TaxID=1812858 RepID=A0A371AV00_9FIRM|nr:Maf family protein [Anaerosacchariphilus polymeriproducens]RDU23369.1 septum formation inhibitor Maf [Anaerosacchariphilus polymeriproducens]